MRSLWPAVRPHLPAPALRALQAGHRQYLGWQCRRQDRLDRHRPDAGRGPTPLPPAALRFRVGGSLDPEHFRAVGRRTVADIARVLDAAGARLDGFADVLDFGCGCGRTLSAMASTIQGPAWHSCDIDAEAIGWCRDHLPFASVAVSPALPPLAVPDGSYDFLYAISVFTHIDADRQAAWLAEFRRVLRPDGLALITVHGDRAAAALPPELRAKIAAEGFLYVRGGSTSGLFPDWYQSSYQTVEQVARSFAPHLDVVAHHPAGVNDHQDAVLLRRPAGSP